MQKTPPNCKVGLGEMFFVVCNLHLQNLCNQHALVITVGAGFIQHTPDKSLLVNKSADFLDVRVKNLDFGQSLVAFELATSAIE